MKKFLLFVICCAMTCLDVMAWSGGNDYVTCSVDYDYGVQKVVSTQAGGFADLLATSNFNQYMDNEDVIFSGPMNAADLQAMSADIWKNVRFLDFSNVTGLTADDIDNLLPSSSNHRACLIIMPKTVDVTPTIIKDVFQTRIGGNNGNRNYGFFMGGNTGIINVLENLAYNSVFSDFVNGLKYIYSTDQAVGGLCFHYSYASTNATDYPTYGGEVSYEWGQNFYNDSNKEYPTFFDAMKTIPVTSLDLSGVYAAAVGYSFANFNENTHYFIIPINTTDKTVNFSDESASTQSLIQYTDNVWVVANVKGTKWGDGTTNCPYGTDRDSQNKYRDINTTDLGESAVITYVRKAGELGNAGQWAPNEYKNATHSVILGKLNPTDLSSMANMTHKCMDLSYAEFVDGATASNLTCTNAHYVALPYNSTKEAVDKAYKALSNGSLKCVSAFVKTAIAEAEGVQAVPANTLITYSKEQGHVNHAQYMLRSLEGNRAVNVNNLIMSGRLNAFDICQSTGGQAQQKAPVVLGSDGHLYYQGNLPEGVSDVTTNYASGGTLFGASLATIDFTNAIFDQPDPSALVSSSCSGYFTPEEKKNLVTDMNFVSLAIVPTTKLLLPTHESQKVIPAYFMSGTNNGTIESICIPYNFQYIMDYAFNGCGHDLAHIYTSKGAGDTNLVDGVVDHGFTRGANGKIDWSTYTISSNVKYIAVGAFDTNTDCPVGDVYVLALNAPICEKDAFCSNKYFGNNGFKNVTPVCRDNYVNGGSWIAVLHFPNALNDEAKKKYTDIDRRYFLQDQTGAVDGDGNPIAWPAHSEFMRSWHQALTGYTWNDWSTNRCMVPTDGRFGQIFAVGGQDKDIPSTEGTIEVENSTWDATKNSYEADGTKKTYTNQRANCDKCGFESYIGWHQFLLARSDYFYEHKDDNYVQTPWYTFCVPYNMTKDELKRFLGGKDNQMPEVRTLVAAKRHTYKNYIDLIISQDLVSNNKDIALTPGETNTSLGRTCMGYEYVDINTTKVSANDVYVKGGYPYFVRGWIPEKEYQANGFPRNLAAYVLAKANYGTSDLGLVTKVSTQAQTMYNGGSLDGYIATPFFNHTVNAIAVDKVVDANTGEVSYVEKFYDDASRPITAPMQKGVYNYNFVGNYDLTVENVVSGNYTMDVLSKYIPADSYYMTRFMRGDAWDAILYRAITKKYAWNPYICVISHNGVASLVSKKISEVDTYYAKYQNVLKDYLWGADEFNTDNPGDSEDPNSAKFALYFEEDYPDVDNSVIDGVRNITNAEATASDNKIYSVSGQYLGTSVKGLQKGIYVINGKKVIVE